MRIGRIILLPLIVLGLSFAGCGKIGKKKNVPGPNDRVYTVLLTAVEEREVPDVIKLSGHFIPLNQLEIKSDFTGKVQALSVEEGQNVFAGEVLLKIEDEKLPWVLERERSSLREAEAQLDYDRARGFAGPEEEFEEEAEGGSVQEGEGGEEGFFQQSEQEAEQPEQQEGFEEQQAEAQPETEENDEEEGYQDEEDQSPMARLARLRQRAQLARQRAQSRIQQRQAAPAAPRVENPEESRSREALDQAKIDRLRAEVALTEKQMEGSTITTSIDGVVTRVEVVEGGSVKPEDILLEILTVDPIELSLRLPKEEVGRIDKNMAVKVIVPDLSNLTFDGEISFIGASLEEDQRTIEVRIRIPNREAKIKVGMEGIAEMAIERAAHRALLVPQSAVLQRDGRSVVYVVDGQSAVETTVETGGSVEGWVEIRHGLRARDQVVSGGIEQLKGAEEFIKTGP